MRLQHRIPVVLCALFALVILWETGHEPVGVAVDSTAPPVLQDEISRLLADADPSVRFPPLRQFHTMLERPLFDATRRPAATGETAAAAVSAELRQLTLTGVVITPEATLAILQHKSRKTTLRLEPGAMVQSWQLDSVHPDRAVFRKGRQTRELFLMENEPKQKRSASEIMPRADGKPLLGKKM